MLVEWLFAREFNEENPPTLDILSRFLNYKSWDDFVEHVNAPEERQSAIVLAPFVRTQDLLVSQKIEVGWKPNRRCVFE